MKTPHSLRSANDFPGLAGRRILIILTTLDLGGAERQALHLASYLQDRCGAHVGIAALFGGTGNQIVRHLCRERRLACLRTSMPNHNNASPTFESIRQFAREMRFLRPDVLLPYTSLPNVLCGVTWRMADAKVCIWNQRDEGRELPGEHWQLAAVKNTRCFISNSRVGLECLVRELGVASEQTNLVFNGVALPPAKESRSAWRERLAIGPSEKVGVMVANLHRFKDHVTLVRAWRIVCDRDAAMRPTLLLAGRQDDVTPVQSLVQELGLKSQVRFLGPVADVAGLLQAADLAVFSSDDEGTPNAVLEAMAANLAVVATDIPGCRDALGEAYPYLVPSKSPEIFADKILALLRDSNLGKGVGKKLSLRVGEQFPVERMCHKTCHIMEQQLLQAGSTPA